MWHIAAPLCAAEKHSLAISSGVTGKLELCSRVVKLPVTAQLKIVGFIAIACCVGQDQRLHSLTRLPIIPT